MGWWSRECILIWAGNTDIGYPEDGISKEMMTVTNKLIFSIKSKIIDYVNNVINWL